MSTQHWMLQENPAYKVAHQGVSALTDRELLLSIISKPEAAQNLLTHYGSLADIARASATELTQVEGVSAYMAHLLICCFELARRKRLDRNQRFQVTGSASAATYLTPLLVDESQEVFYVLFLNRRHDIIAEKALFRGGVSATVVDPKLIFRHAIHHLASGIIVAHNHPSGQRRPSQADLEITRKLVAGAKLFDIAFLDHVIITHEGYYSFADEGML